MMDELISIIVPIYLGEKWLSRCIETIRKQTYTNLEIVLVDDGSPDRSGAISDEYALVDSRIKVVHKENGGLSDARNAGIDASSGQYIMFVDEDDMIHPQMVELMYQTMTYTGSDIVVCRFDSVPDKDISVYPKITKVENPACFEGHDVMNQLEFRNLLTVVAWNKLYRRHIYNHYRYIKGRVHDDESAIHYFLHECKKIAYMNEVLYYYVQREGSITSKRKWSYYSDGWIAYEERLKFLEDKGYTEMTLWTKEQMLRYASNYYRNIYRVPEAKHIAKQMRTVFRQILADTNVKKILTKQQISRYRYFNINPKLFELSVTWSILKDNIIEKLKKPIRALRSQSRK